MAWSCSSTGDFWLSGTHAQLQPSRLKGRGRSFSPELRGPFSPFSYVLQSHHSIHSVRGSTKPRWQIEQHRPPADLTSRAYRSNRSINSGNSASSESGTRSRRLDLASERRETSRREGTLDFILSDMMFVCASVMGKPSMLNRWIGPMAMWIGAHASSGTGVSYPILRRASSGDVCVVPFGECHWAIFASSICQSGFGRTIRCFKSPFLINHNSSHGR